MARRARPWYRTSRGQWYVQVGGKQVPLGVTDPAAEAQAWAAFQALLQQQPAPAGRTCADVVSAYLAAAAARVKPHTLKVYKWYLGAFLARHGTVSVHTLTAAAVEADAARAGWSPTTAHNYLAAVEMMLRWAGVRLALRKPAKASAGSASVIPPEVYRQLLGHCTGDWHAVTVFLWHTGCRPSEAAAVTAEAVDWPAGVVTLAEHKTAGATGRPRLIYCSGPAREVLRWQRAKYRTGLLFRAHGGGRLSRQAFVVKFWRLSKRVGRRVTAYMFRHSYATRALAAGESDAHVAALLGHMSTQMVWRHYAHLSSQGRALRDAADRLGGAA